MSIPPSSAIRSEFAASRTWLSEYVESLPMSVKAVALAHIEGRSTQKPMLGEIVLAIVEELFQTQPSARDLVRPAWLKLYWSSLFLDDLLDKRAESQAAILSTLFLQSALNDIHRLFPEDQNLCFLIDRYCHLTAEAVANQHTSPDRVYIGLPISEYSGKLSLLKVAATALFLGSNKDPATQDLIILDEAGFAVQLLDDLTDYAEDWRAGIRTMPLVGWTDMSSQPCHADRASSQLEALHRSVISGTFEECIMLALSVLKSVQGRLPANASTHRYIGVVLTDWTGLATAAAGYREIALVEGHTDLVQLEALDLKIDHIAQST